MSNTHILMTLGVKYLDTVSSFQLLAFLFTDKYFIGSGGVLSGILLRTFV